MPEPTYLTDPAQGSPESPRHGFQGDRGAPAVRPQVPASLTIAVSREAGARGTPIANRAGAKLGWQVYPQELLEYLSQESNFRQDILENLSPPALRWVDEQLDRLQREETLVRHPSLTDLARMIFALGATGEVILIGRGAGLMLPRASTLHVRLVAPLEDRIAYMSQWLRLTEDEAAEQVKQRDQRRAEFIESHFFRAPGDVHQYDLVLNSSFLGEEQCAELIAEAARAKLAGLKPTSDPDLNLN